MYITLLYEGRSKNKANLRGEACKIQTETMASYHFTLGEGELGQMSHSTLKFFTRS